MCFSLFISFLTALRAECNFLKLQLPNLLDLKNLKSFTLSFAWLELSGNVGSAPRNIWPTQRPQGEPSAKAGRFGFAVLQLSAKNGFQAKMTAKTIYFWAGRIKIAYPKPKAHFLTIITNFSNQQQLQKLVSAVKKWRKRQSFSGGKVECSQNWPQRSWNTCKEARDITNMRQPAL